MKLQNLAIIFLIIIIPIVSIFSLYLKLEIKTITMQTDYDGKLIEATKEAVNAFEINTTEWNSKYSTLANVKRQDLLSAINVFTESLANKLGIGGISKESILAYIPAIVFTMYDGYYIYAPTYVPQTITDDNGVQLFYYENAEENNKITNSATQNIEGTIFAGEPVYVGTDLSARYNGSMINFTVNSDNAEKTYKHVLKTFVPYTKTYEFKGENYVINYTLDNYIRIYGKDKMMEGYIVDNAYLGNNKWKFNIPINSIEKLSYDGNSVQCENLSENIPIQNNETQQIEIKEYAYIYNSNNDKRYYDNATNRFFTVNNKNEKVYLPEGVEVGNALAEYKKILVRTTEDKPDYIELYQLLNKNDSNWYYIDNDNQYKEYSLVDDSIRNIDRSQDCSAINYYVECFDFNVILRQAEGIDLEESQIREITEGRKQAIINNINTNLNLSISNYSANSRMDYKIPELSDSDWEQALSNMSMIVFFQGKKIGLKTYNNYAIVTSTENNEFINEDSLFYIGQDEDLYYHIRGCDKIKTNINTAYRHIDYKVVSYGDKDSTKYYYRHNGQIQQCFDCIVNRNNYSKMTDMKEYNKIFYEALGRERYIQMQRTKVIK